MNLKKLFSFCFIVCALALSALLFCFPASAKTYDVSSDELFSKALDESVDGDVINVNSKVSLSKDINKEITINTAENDIIIQGDLTLENVTINGRIRVLKGNKLTIGNQAVLSNSKKFSNTLTINEGTAVLDGGIISFDDESDFAVRMTKGKFEIISGKITANGSGIILRGGDLSMSGGEIMTSGSGGGIMALQHEGVGSNVILTGGSIIASGEESIAISIYNYCNLKMTKGTAYGEKEALYVRDASATVIHPAKLRSVNLQKASSERANVYIDPICEYYNPDTDAVSSMKMDIIADDIITTLDIDDIAKKDLFYFDIPNITDQFTDFQIYDALDENNALAYAEIDVNPNIDNRKQSGYLHSYVTEVFFNIKLFYNNKLEEKQIKVVLFQPNFEGIRIEPDVIVGKWNKEFYSRYYTNVKVYDVCKSVIVSLPEGIENNKIKSFEVLDKINTNVSYKKLGNNKYKVDLTTSPISEEPSIRLKIQFKDGYTMEDRFYFKKIVFIEKTFNDIDNSYAKTQIEVLSSKGYYSWIEGDSFNPTRDITRAEFLYLVMKALKFDTDFNDNFEDVKKTDYYYQAIGAAKKLGITKGIGNNNYGVNQGITRQDMSTILVNALSVYGVSAHEGDDARLERFTDKDKIAAYARSSLATLVEYGLLVGHNDILDPDGSFSMQQAAVVIYKINSD